MKRSIDSLTVGVKHLHKQPDPETFRNIYAAQVVIKRLSLTDDTGILGAFEDATDKDYAEFGKKIVQAIIDKKLGNL